MTAENWIRISHNRKPQLNRSARVCKDLVIHAILEV